MIALVTAGRGGGDGGPVILTAPWSPGIVARGGQMPGSVVRALQKILGIIQKRGLCEDFARMRHAEFLPIALEATGHRYIEALNMLLSRDLLLELGMLKVPS